MVREDQERVVREDQDQRDTTLPSKNVHSVFCIMTTLPVLVCDSLECLALFRQTHILYAYNSPGIDHEQRTGMVAACHCAFSVNNTI